MREPQNIADVAALEVDYIGFIFYEKSPRYLLEYPPELLVQTPRKARKLSVGTLTTAKVGVFVNHSIDFILEKVQTFGLDLVQLHGHETAEFCRQLRVVSEDIDNSTVVVENTRGANTNNGENGDKTQTVVSDPVSRFRIKIIKAFSIGDNFDLSQLTDYKPLVDYFLFDTKGKNLGGNGVTFNWEILNHYDQEIPFFLSGGIDIQYVEEIRKLKNLNVHALDINSKFEVSAGVKDVEKIKNFIQLLKDQLPIQ